MTIDIPTEYQSFVQTVIARGTFATEAHVITEALRLLRERERRLDELRKQVQVGLDQLDHGEFDEYDDASLRQFFDEIKAEGRKRLGQIGDRMSRFRISREARTDLEEIWAFVARDNPSAADALIDAFHARFRLLATRPLMGQARDELGEGLRSFSIGNYVVVFRAANGGIRIVRIIHAARNIEDLF